MDRCRQSERASGRGARVKGLVSLIALTVVVTVAWAVEAVGLEEPVAEEAVVPQVVDTHLDRRAPREATGLILPRGGWKYDCMECHRSLKSKWHLDSTLMEHRGLELKHGNNRFCLNCHHPENRNAFVDYDGSEIAEGDVVLLCAKCHGPQHRDWQVGAHGRENGFWDASQGLTERLRCIQCHDPHDPAFKAMEPWAAPTYPARAAGKRLKKAEHKEDLKHGE